MKNTIIVVGVVLIVIVAVALCATLIKTDKDEDNNNNEPLFLTPLIENGDLANARAKSSVKLKGASNITSHSGLFTVNKQYNSTLFFWYFESETEKDSAPVLLWLNGGPGTTSMLGLIEEHGPFLLDSDSFDLKFRNHYWTKNHHVIYIDNPVGVGYSFTDDEKGYSTSAEDCAINLHEALRQFFELFPNLKKHSFFLTGESYAGKYVPALGSVILDKNVITNFKGVAIGNGLIDPETQSQGFGEYLYWQGFLDREELKQFQDYEQKCSTSIKNQDLQTALKYCRALVDPWNQDTLFYKYTGYTYTYNILEPFKNEQQSKHREDYLNSPDTRRAIHVGHLPRIQNPSKIQEKLGFSLLASEKEHIDKILKSGKEVMIFNGELDVQIPYRLSVFLIESLDYAAQNGYKKSPRKIWLVNDEVAGYVKIAGLLQEVMVIGTGHMVPEDKPVEGSDLITRFTRGQALEVKTV